MGIIDRPWAWITDAYQRETERTDSADPAEDMGNDRTAALVRRLA